MARPIVHDVTRPIRVADRSRLSQPTIRRPHALRPAVRISEMVEHKATAKSQAAPRDVATPSVIRPEPYASPARPKTEPSRVLRREMINAPQDSALVLVPTKAKSKLGKVQIVLLSMACLVFALGVLVNIQTIHTNRTAKAQVSALANKSRDQVASNNAPTEDKPAISTYKVTPDLPKFLKIDKLNISARVVPIGVKTNNELMAPSNIYDAGWYNASSKPGASSAGATLIDGHVHGPTLPGIFTGLVKLKPDDHIQIVRGDDKVFDYKVIKVQNYDVNALDMSIALQSVQSGKAGLNLITCGGKFDKSTQTYKQRTIVFAVQQN